MRASITSGTAEPRSTTSGRPIGGPAICAAASKSSRPWTTPPHGSGWTAFSSASSPTPSFGVGELALENAVQPLPCGGVVHGRDDFDAAAQIAGPPIGRPDVVLRGSAVPEVIDARVLEEAAQHAHHLDPRG